MLTIPIIRNFYFFLSIKMRTFVLAKSTKD